jgi:hypothetical protein
MQRREDVKEVLSTVWSLLSLLCVGEALTYASFIRLLDFHFGGTIDIATVRGMFMASQSVRASDGLAYLQYILSPFLQNSQQRSRFVAKL